MRALTADLLMPPNGTLQLGTADLAVHYQHGGPMNQFRDDDERRQGALYTMVHHLMVRYI